MASGTSFLGKVAGIFKTVGADALRVLGLITQNAGTVANIVSMADPAIAPEVQIIGQAVASFAGPVTTAEAAFAAAGAVKSGTAKMAVVLPATTQLVEQAMVQSGLVTVDQVKFDKAIQELTQGTVDLLDSIGKPAGSAQSPAAPAA